MSRVGDCLIVGLVVGYELMFLELILRVTPLNPGELKVLGGTHGTEPLRLLGGEMGLEIQTTPPPQ